MKHKTEDFRSPPPVEIIHQHRQTLAMRVTPAGIEVLIPADLDADSPRVQAFVEAGLRRLPSSAPEALSKQLTPEDLHGLVAGWVQRIGVHITRTQIRAMRNKWASCSTKGTLTLSTDLLRLPIALAEYVICHELLHLKVPSHTRAFWTLLGCYLPDWQERERNLVRWVASDSKGNASSGSALTP